MQRYVVLIAYPRGSWGDATAEQQAWAREHDDFASAVGQNLLAGEALVDPEAATTLRHDGPGRPVLTDGPFAETTEVIGGMYLLQAPDLDRVIAWCELLPEIYSIEIRPTADV